MLSAGATFTTQDALTDALTIEGLLFVAFSLAFSLSASKPGGTHPFFAQGWFGWLVTLAITCIAVSAVADWWQLFNHHWPKNAIGTAQVFGLLVGICVQPAFAAIINWQAKKNS